MKDRAQKNKLRTDTIALQVKDSQVEQADLRKSLRVQTASLERTRTIANSQAYATFLQDEANGYQSNIASWDTQQNAAWSDYHLALANAEVSWRLRSVRLIQRMSNR